ncbi:hypothetical protein Taro_047710 [Colocasia esculenta]|uniref:GATA-type domain-containing protein n=1 Tax=Colocasia esculenta TaxID=4460 RepID=A0A843X6W8_COLES|nr:hypothetical protein [Colocasia esculenta]
MPKLKAVWKRVCLSSCLQPLNVFLAILGKWGINPFRSSVAPFAMTPMQRSLYSHLPPLEEGSHHHHQVYLHPFLPTYETSFPCAFFISSCQEGSSESDHQHDRAPQEEVKEQFSFSGSSDEHSSALRSPATIEDGESRHKNNAGEGDPSDSGSVRWMSSKMRFMRKMMGSDKMIAPVSRPRKIVQGLQDQLGKIGESNNSHNSPPTGTVRVCSDCNTTKTPLWRSGPRGPKSLCNACGIRQRKARRAMAAAAARTGGVIPAAVAPAKVRKEKRSAGSDCTVPFKKRFKFTAAAQNRKKLHFDELAIGLSKNSAFQRVLPQDEKEEAAILLMALSCGLIRG